MSKINKFCPGCCEKFPAAEMNAQGSYCRPCHAGRLRHWRSLNRKRNLEIQAAYRARNGQKAPRDRRQLTAEELAARSARRKNCLRDEAAKFVFDHLCQHPCTDCGENNPLRLTFDHVRGEKICDVSTAHSTKAWPLVAIREEIEKCDVRCWNCHMERTARTFGYRRVKLWDEYRGLA